MRVEGEVSVDEGYEIGGLLQSKTLFVVPHPAVEFRTDEIEVLRRRSPPPFTDSLCVLASEP